MLNTRLIVIIGFLASLFISNKVLGQTCPLPTYNAGSWATYAVGDYVTSSGQAYICVSLTNRHILPGAAWSLVSNPCTSTPSVTTNAGSAIGCTSATLNGNVSGTVTAKGFVWSTSNVTPTLADNVITHATSATGAYSSNFTGLSASTTYYVRAYATNANGTAYGSKVDVVTLTSCPVINTTSYSATSCIAPIAYNLVGNLVSVPGGMTISTRGFVYGTAPNPTTSNSVVNSGSTSTGSYTVSASGLTSGTTYYARAYVVSSTGVTFYGSEISFTSCNKKWVSTGAAGTFDYYLGGIYQGTVAKATIPTTIAAGDSLIIQHNNCSFGTTDINPVASTACTPDFNASYNDPAWMAAAGCNRLDLTYIYGTVIIKSGGFLVNGTGIEVKAGGKLLVDGSGSANQTRFVSWGAVYNYGTSQLLNNGRWDLNGSLNSSAGAVVTTNGAFKCCGSLQNYAPSCFNGNCTDQTISCASILPVVFIDFNAVHLSNGNLLNWSTAEEINAKSFIIERSLDGRNFEAIGTVDAYGNSSTIKKYQYIDKEVNYELVYYRLNEIDKDGKSMYSNVVAVRNESNETAVLIGNPVKEEIKIQLLSDEDNLVSLINSQGALLFEKSYTGKQQVNIKSQFASGVYFVKVTNNSQSSTMKVIVE